MVVCIPSAFRKCRCVLHTNRIFTRNRTACEYVKYYQFLNHIPHNNFIFVVMCVLQKLRCVHMPRLVHCSARNCRAISLVFVTILVYFFATLRWEVLHKDSSLLIVAYAQALSHSVSSSLLFCNLCICNGSLICMIVVFYTNIYEIK